MPADAFMQALGHPVAVEPGCSLLEKEHFLAREDWERDPCYAEPGDYWNRAVKAAAEADIVVMMLGEHSEQSGESASQSTLALPRIQTDLLKEIHKVNPNIVTVLFSGRPNALDEVCRYSRAVLEAWLCGDAGMEGVANLLAGKANPSGKLAMSFPFSAGQCPIHYDAYPTARPGNDRTVKFKTRYLDVPNAPRYPFGYGLSYTEFQYSTIRGDRKTVTAQQPLTLQVNVTNMGNQSGEAVVQLYLRDQAASLVSRPERELAGFQRIFLRPGESREAVFSVTEEMLRFYDAECSCHSEPGRHTAYIGGDSTAENSFEFCFMGTD